MAVSIASKTPGVSWQQITRKILSGDPLEVLDRLDAAAQTAEQDGDASLLVATSASALAFMLIDWSRFTGWQMWISRFEQGEALLLSDATNANLGLMRATGAMACALLRGDAQESLAPLGQRLESLIDGVTDSTQLALAAGALLPWLQMSKNPAAAQALHSRMAASAAQSLLESAGVQYLRATWLSSWAQHLHFSNEHERLGGALLALDEYLGQPPLPLLQFRRARLAAENALYEKDNDGAEREVRKMLNALHARRPMERVIYNAVAAAVASSRNDPDRAFLHVTHNVRDLAAADCPPSIATVYRMIETRVHLARADYEQAAGIFEHCMENAHTAHAAVYRGFAQLSHALLAHERGSVVDESMREHLRIGLATVRAIPAVNFFFSAPAARATVCALALRESIEAEFVRTALQQFPVPPPIWADEHWPWAMSLRCFAGFRSEGLLTEGRGSSKVSNKPLNLLMLVAASGAQGVPVAFAADTLWPGQDGDQAENSLSVTLLRLRRLYDETDLIERRSGWLHLNPQRVWTDVAALETHLDAMPERTVAMSETDRVKYVARLFDLYRGDCLLGIEDEWALRRATHYRSRVTLATQRLLQDALLADQYAVAELAVMRAFERGLDVGRMLASVHSGERGTAAWTRLQQCVALLETN